jgi:leucyl/phenylalanyl-tRNA---protein transferase
MSVFRLSDGLDFPPPEATDPNGVLAEGGDLSRERLLFAYSRGIFPWYSRGSPILWWCPDPRLVLFPEELKVSRSLRKILSKGMHQVTMDTRFHEVITRCAEAEGRPHEEDAWLDEEMQAAYRELHRCGYAHSVETWMGGELVGGLYGVSMGKAFFGESMFATATNASKIALFALVQKLTQWDFTLIDCQVTSEHLKSLGAREIPRREFLNLLSAATKAPTVLGPWNRTI